MPTSFNSLPGYTEAATPIGKVIRVRKAEDIEAAFKARKELLTVTSVEAKIIGQKKIVGRSKGISVDGMEYKVAPGNRQVIRTQYGYAFLSQPSLSR